MNWGIIGYGEICPSFIKGLEASATGNLIGLASLSSFEYLSKKKPYDNVLYFDNYEELLCIESIEIIYICTTNNSHYKNVKLALEAGKHVLCEKPMTPSHKQTTELFEISNTKNLFLMEGMWTRFLPAYRKAIKLLKEGIIDKPKLLKVDFGFMNNWSKHRRLLNPKLYGGTLLDNADYNIFLSQDIFNEFPVDIKSQATFADTGVEDACSILLKYECGGMAQLFSSFRCETLQEAIIYGEKGYLRLSEYWHGTKIEIKVDGSIKIENYPFNENGFEYEINAVEKAIKEGNIEHNLIPKKTSLEVAKIIDIVKQQISNT